MHSQLSADVHPLTTSHWSNIHTRVRTILLRRCSPCNALQRLDPCNPPRRDFLHFGGLNLYLRAGWGTGDATYADYRGSDAEASAGPWGRRPQLPPTRPLS